MKLDVAAVFDELLSAIGRLPLAQKIAIPLLFAASVAVVVFIARWGSRPDYGVLFSGLQETDSAAVIEQLKAKKVGFRLADEGRTVEITPPKLVHELRLELVASGIPKGGKLGYELFSETTLGRTRFAEEMLGVQALQGELERTILGISSIKNVRVHITRPKRSVFAKKDLVPTASVLLQLKSGEELTKNNIKGIANLVAGAVEGLEPQKVTILDQQGRMLNQQDNADEAGGGDLPRLEYQRRFEREASTQIETMLAEILGPGKAVARVTADLDFSKREREEENFDPGGAVVLSERTVDDGAQVSSEGGVPGVLSNLTNNRGLLSPPNSGQGGSSRRESTRNYQVSRAKSITVGATGTVKRLTVAVLVDGHYKEAPAKAGEKEKEADAAQGAGTKIFEPLSVEMLAKIESLVKQAVGFDPVRGDVVTVENIQFFEADPQMASLLESNASTSQAMSLAPHIIQGIAIIFFFLFLVRPLVRSLVSPSEAEVDLTRLLPAGVEELEAELESERHRTIALPEVHEPVVDIVELEKLIGMNSKIVKDNPQQAALLIRYWLNEGRL